MKFTPTRIPEVMLIEPDVFRDKRGYFFEFYRKELFRKHGIRDVFVQDNHSASMKGALRGLHYQTAPKTQAKLVRVIRGEALDVAVDIRKNSKSFGQCVAHLLSEKNRKMLYIPKGFAHGFLTLKDNTEFLYKVSDFYSPAHERGILWSDPALAIPWPKIGLKYLVSKKDSQYPLLKQIPKEDLL